MTSYLRSWWFGTTPSTTPANDALRPTSTNELSVSVLTPEETQDIIDEAAARNAIPTNATVSISTPEETQDTIDECADCNTTVSISSPEETVEAPGAPSTTVSISPPARSATVSISNPDEDDDDDDMPPAFPSLNSAQRARPDTTLMPPPSLIPPVPRNLRTPPAPRGTSNTLMLPTSTSRGTSSSLMPPPSTTRTPVRSSKRREKVALAPGHSPLDWAALKTSGTDLRGVTTLTRITPSQLKRHNTRADAWSAFNGKVYNVTSYLAFHPGGEKELMRVAGRDGTKLFGLTHAWVNVDIMLDECLVGFLVPEPSSAA